MATGNAPRRMLSILSAAPVHLRPDREGVGMTNTEIVLCIICAAVTLVAVAAIRAAYCNGVTDGYGYSREPNCPGYAKAGEYLKAVMSHRWPELKEPANERREVDGG